MKPSFSTEGTYAPASIFAGDFPRVQHQVTILSGQNLVAGTVLGKITVGTIGVPAMVGTGNGVFGAITAGAKLKPGTYTILCITAAANAGTFIMIDPDGNRIGKDITVAVAYTNDHMAFTIADGATDFIVGDKFTIAVSGSGKYIKSLSAAVDGSQVPAEILAEAIDASAGDVAGVSYQTGEYLGSALTFGTGHTATSTKAGLAAKSIFLK